MDPWEESLLAPSQKSTLAPSLTGTVTPSQPKTLAPSQTSILAPSQKANRMNLQKKIKKGQTAAKKGKTSDVMLGNESGDPEQNVDAQPMAQLDDDKAEYQMAIAETFADYKPIKLKIGLPHPDPVVETSTLSSVEPVDITYELALPKRTIEKGALSALQLESIVYASQAHGHYLPDECRAGFLIGKCF